MIPIRNNAIGRELIEDLEQNKTRPEMSRDNIYDALEKLVK